MPARFRGALYALPLVLLVACGGGGGGTSVNPTANDPKPTTSGVTADFDPSTGNIPLPNVLATAATTTPITLTAGVPLTPDKALVYINQREVGNTNAVSGVNAPFYLSFSGAVDAATVNASTVKVFLVLPDSPSNPSSTENNPLGFVDVSAHFTYQVLPSGKEIYVTPQVPMLPAHRYLCVATTGVHDTSGVAIGSSLIFGIEKYVKGGATSSATDTTNLADLTDTSNPAAVLGQATATQLEQIAANVTVSGNIAFSGFRKTMWDLIAASGTTGISSRSQIAVMARTITTAAGYLPSDGASPSTSLTPVETLMYAWANNAGTFTQANGATGWTNYPTMYLTLASDNASNSSTTVDAWFSSLPSPLNLAPHNAIDNVVYGAFNSADLQMDPAVVASLSGKPSTGDLTSFLGSNPNVYNPGTSSVPGTGVYQAVYNNGSNGPVGGAGKLTGFYYKPQSVSFLYLAPKGTAPAGGWPIAIFLHGIGGQKEQAVLMANAACAAGYAVIAIDQVRHGDLSDGEPASDWASNFFMLPSTLTARTNVMNSAFNLFRLERILNEPTVDALSFQKNSANQGYPIDANPAHRKFIGQSLGSIVGTVFLAGNAGATGGSNIPGLLSVPGSRLAFILHDSPAFKSAVDAGLAAAGVPTGSPTYNKFFVLAQSVVDSVDPATMMGPLPTGGASRLAGRVLAQEAVGDQVIPNAEGRYWANAMAGRTPQLGGDISGGYTQVLASGQSSPAEAFIFGSSFTSFKAAVAAATGSATSPTQGHFQFGTPASPANHGLLLDGSANTAAAQTQMARWLATGLVTDGAAAYPLAPIQKLPAVPATPLFGPESLQLYYPQAK